MTLNTAVEDWDDFQGNQWFNFSNAWTSLGTT